jgi:hypothetical protein
MTSNTHVSEFIQQITPTQTLWALQDKNSEGWVVLDSINFENAEVMPLWSTSELATMHCIDEWADYIPAAISVADWLEFWVEDLAEDNIMIGVNWLNEDDDVELELADFSQLVSEIEVFHKGH